MKKLRVFPDARIGKWILVKLNFKKMMPPPPHPTHTTHSLKYWKPSIFIGEDGKVVIPDRKWAP